MGTNYYATHGSCETCGRFERTHICKSLTSFQGHFDWTGDGVPMPWLTSWADWKVFLASDDVDYVVDEYGDKYTVTDFIAMVEATSREARRRQHDWMVAHEPARCGRVAEGCDWLDADGFSFYGGGFE